VNESRSPIARGKEEIVMTKETIEGQQPEADSGKDYPLPTPSAATAAQFYAGVIGPATLSVDASRLAVEKAADADTRQFANFELREAIAVTAVLGSLNVPVPPINSGGQALLDKLQTTASGTDFDKTYIVAELANHEFLRDLAESYLKNATGSAGTEEQYGRRVATLVLTAFKEHVVLSKNIVHSMRA
jgi:predicted outer membrane protein